MATIQTLICDRCGGKRGVERRVLEFGPDAAWVIDLDEPCHLEAINEISRLLGAPRTTARIARAERVTVTGDAPYAAAEGLSLPDVRSWAQRHDIPVSGRGRINTAVLNLYRTCQEKGDRYLNTKEAQRIIEGL